MKKLVLSTIKRHKLLSEGETVVLGLSGGADSVALLHILSELKDELGIDIIAVHLNHGIRGEEADRDASFSEMIAERLGVSCVVVRADVPGMAKEKGLSLEEAGRIARYEAFVRVAREHNSKVIAVAHHADDQVETILFNMVRGSSLSGICGMDFKSNVLGHEDIAIIRPLLEVDRKAIEQYLKSKAISEWCTDSTNLENEYARNKLRNLVIPELKGINSRASEHIVKEASDLHEVFEYVELEASKKFNEKYSDGALEIDGLDKLPVFLAKQVLYKFICTICGRKKDIERAHVDSVYELLNAQSGKIIDLPYGARVKKSYTRLVSLKDQDTSFEEGSILFDELEQKGEMVFGGLSVSLYCKTGEFVAPKDKSVVYFDYDKLATETDRLSLRGPEEDDYFCPFTDGRKKTISRLLIDEKIEARKSVRVLAFDKHVVYIVGLRNDESYRISESTQKILEIRRLP